jgi:hypothetical protein
LDRAPGTATANSRLVDRLTSSRLRFPLKLPRQAIGARMIGGGRLELLSLSFCLFLTGVLPRESLWPRVRGFREAFQYVVRVYHISIELTNDKNLTVRYKVYLSLSADFVRMEAEV